MGPYVLDFYCAGAALAVEVDGMSHNLGDNPTRDARRDAWLREKGIRTLRFDAADVLNDMDNVLRAIIEASSSPSTMGRGTTRRVVEG